MLFFQGSMHVAPLRNCAQRAHDSVRAKFWVCIALLHGFDESRWAIMANASPCRQFIQPWAMTARRVRVMWRGLKTTIRNSLMLIESMRSSARNHTPPPPHFVDFAGRSLCVTPHSCTVQAAHTLLHPILHSSLYADNAACANCKQL